MRWPTWVRLTAALLYCLGFLIYLKSKYLFAFVEVYMFHLRKVETKFIKRLFYYSFMNIDVLFIYVLLKAFWNNEAGGLTSALLPGLLGQHHVLRGAAALLPQKLPGTDLPPLSLGQVRLLRAAGLPDGLPQLLRVRGNREVHA